MLNLPAGDHEPNLELPSPLIRRLEEARPNRVWPFLVPGLLIISLMIGVFILAYGLGVDKGKRSANDERDSFYQDRIARLGGTPNSLTTPGAGLVFGSNQVSARIDKIEGNKVTVILLSPNGAPSGVSLVVVIGTETQVFKSSNAQTGELHPGDNIILIGEKSGDTFTPRSIVILPPAG